MRRVTRSTSADERRRRAPRARSASARARAARRWSRRRRAACTGRGSRLWASACRWRPDAAAEHRDQRAARRARRPRPTVRDPALVELARPWPARRPRAARPAAGGGTPARRPAATTSRPSGLATPLATLARNFVARDADGDRAGRPARARRGRRRAAISRGRARDPLAARARRGTPRRSTGPRRAGSCRSKTSNTALLAST